MFEGILTGREIKARNNNPELLGLGDDFFYSYKEKDTFTNGFPDHVALMVLTKEEEAKQIRIHELNTYIEKVRNTGIDVTAEQEELKTLLGL